MPLALCLAIIGNMIAVQAGWMNRRLFLR
jgi:hypothetical protein